MTNKYIGVKSDRKGHFTFRGPLIVEKFLRTTRKLLSHHHPEKENKTVAIVRFTA